MKQHSIFLGAILATLVAAPVVAQTAATPPQYTEVTTFEVEPEDAMKLQAVAEKIVKAAGLAKLPANRGWTFWNDVYRFAVVGSFHTGDLADPQVWVKLFSGTPGEALMNEALADFQKIRVRNTTTELMQNMNEWGYTAANAPTGAPQWAEVFDVYVKNGAEQQFDALVKEFLGFFKSMGYPYSFAAGQYRFGEQRASFITFHSDPGAFFGANSMESLVAKKGATAKWMELLGKMGQVSTRTSQSRWMYMPTLSYMGY